MSIGGVIQDALVTGLPYAPACLGVWMTFPLQNTFDLTVNGSFIVGAGVFAMWVSMGGPAVVGMLLAVAAGIVCGLATSATMHWLRLGLILSGIIIGTGLFSVALWVMGGPNMTVIGESSVLSWWTETIAGGNKDVASIEFFGLVALALTAAMYGFLRTEYGLLLRANGTSKTMVKANGESPARVLYVSVISGNALVAFSGSLSVEQQGFADVGVGLNTILLGVTAVLIGQLVIGTRRLWQQVSGPLIGLIIYYIVIAEAFNIGLNPIFFQGISAGSVLLLVLIRRLASRSDNRLGAAAGLGEADKGAFT